MISPGEHSLERPDGASVAYVAIPRQEGDRRPGVVFCGGFVSDMTGTKARHFEGVCRARGQAYVRFDYYGHGRSSGRFEDGTIGRWADDAVAVLDAATEGPQILVGSSMGGWVAVLAALARPERVAGLVGIAAAPDFTEELIWAQMDEAARETVRRDGVWQRPTQYADEEPHRITMGLIEEGRRHLLLHGPIALDRPVRLFHALDDPDVPWTQSLRLAERLAASDVRLTLIKQAGHRLSRDEDLALIAGGIAELSDRAQAEGEV
jgi:pimeloyl-ACP methyl ester carboxylesterase